MRGGRRQQRQSLHPAPHGFFEDGAYTDKFHPGRWRVNPSPPADMAGGRRLPAARRRWDLQDQLRREPIPLHRGGEYTGSRHPQTVADVCGRTGRRLLQDDRHQRHAPSTRIRRTPASTRTRGRGSPDSTPKVNRVEVFGEGELGNSTGIAVNSLTGTAYVADRETNDVKIYAAVTTPDITNIGTTTGQTTATISAHLDTAGPGPVTGCEVEYGLEPSYGSSFPARERSPPAAEATSPRTSAGSRPRRSITTDPATNANGTTRTIDRHSFPCGRRRPGPAGDEHHPHERHPQRVIHRQRRTHDLPLRMGHQHLLRQQHTGVPPTSATGRFRPQPTSAELDVYREDSPPYHFRLVATNGPAPPTGPT